MRALYAELGKGHDGVHRCAQLVRHVREELRLAAVRGFCRFLREHRFARALRDQLLQVIAVAAQLLLRKHALGNVLARSAIADEMPGLMEHRLAVDRQPADPTVIAYPAVFERTERQMLPARADVLIPVGRTMV